MPEQSIVCIALLLLLSTDDRWSGWEHTTCRPGVSSFSLGGRWVVSPAFGAQKCPTLSCESPARQPVAGDRG